MPNANHTPDAASVWKQLEDLLVPRLHLTVNERAVYSVLLRHTRLEGKRRSSFSIPWLARCIRMNTTTARRALRLLAGKGALRILARTNRGHLVEVLVPDELATVRAKAEQAPADIEGLDFLAHKVLRNSLYRREGGCCFYCLRQVPRRELCMDHVVPEVANGPNSYRNLVAACQNCNVRKAGKPAEDYLRSLYRLRRLNAGELAQRLRALESLAKGRLKPPLNPASLSRLLPLRRGPRRGRLQLRWA